MGIAGDQKKYVMRLNAVGTAHDQEKCQMGLNAAGIACDEQRGLKDWRLVGIADEEKCLAGLNAVGVAQTRHAWNSFERPGLDKRGGLINDPKFPSRRQDRGLDHMGACCFQDGQLLPPDRHDNRNRHQPSRKIPTMLDR